MRALCPGIFSHFESENLRKSDGAKSKCAQFGLFRLINEFGPRVRAVLYSIFGDPHMAEQISIRVFARAYGRAPLDRDPWVDLVWLTITECQRLRWRTVLLDRLGLGKQQGLKRNGVRKGTERAIALLDNLGWNDRVLLVLREVADLSPEQIATVLHSTAQQVRADLLSARQALLKASKA